MLVFEVAGQRGDMMVDIESGLSGHLTGGQTLIGAAEGLAGNGAPMVEPQEDEPMAEPFGPDDDIADLA